MVLIVSSIDKPILVVAFLRQWVDVAPRSWDVD